MPASETVTRLLETDWSKTPLGAIDQWPRSLRLAVDICQSSRFPMFVWWGPGLINIYNDAYVPMLGRRHPRAFGCPARETWDDIWSVIGPQVDVVMKQGEATWNERVLLVMERHGHKEETYFTWSYSPIRDEDGRVGGLFCACKEETGVILAERERARLAAAFTQSPAFLALLRGPRHVFEFVNERYYGLVGTRDIMGKSATEALPELEGQGFFETLDLVYATGEPFVGTAVKFNVRRRPQEPLEELYIDFVYQPMRDPDGAVAGILVHGVDVTEKRRAEERSREGEARFRQLADAMPQIVFTARPDGEIDYFNRRWYEYTGLPEGSTAFESWKPVHTEEGLRRVMQVWPEAVNTGRPYEIEYPLRRHDGAYRWHLGRALPIKDEHGHIVRWFGTNTDIHALKRLEDELGAEKNALELIAIGSPLPAVLETIVRGVEAQSSDGMICSILVLDEAGERLLHGAAPGLPAAYNQALDGVAIGPAVGSCGTAAFQRRPVFVTDIANDPLWADFRSLAAAHGLAACCSTPIISSDGEVLGTVAMYYRTPRGPSAHDNDLIQSATRLAGIVLEKDSVDRRLRHSLEAEQAARGEAERASRMKDEFLATLSHELRTPLNAILGWTRILRMKPGIPADLAQGVEVIERNARAQATIIQDLLDMSAIISGKVRLKVQPLDVAQLVRNALDTAMPAAQAKQIRLEAVLDDVHGGVMVSGDASRLQQILWNLLSNAVKFTPRGGRIEVVLQRADGHAQIRVTDTGAGIPADFLPYVFDRFRQADASTTRRHGGLGLGLAIVKQLIELHGGTVAVGSEGLGRGATFAVALPLLVRAEAPAAGPEPWSRAPALAASPEERVAVAGLRVLLVDDDLDARDIVRRLLEEHRAVVSTAASAEEAMKILGAKRFDVLVSDIGMPEEDGLALMRQVRALGPKAGGDLPAVALTAYARPEDRDKAVQAGFQLHVAKPFDPAELFALVASVAKKA